MPGRHSANGLGGDGRTGHDRAAVIQNSFITTAGSTHWKTARASSRRGQRGRHTIHRAHGTPARVRLRLASPNHGVAHTYLGLGASPLGGGGVPSRVAVTALRLGATPPPSRDAAGLSLHASPPPETSHDERCPHATESSSP